MFGVLETVSVPHAGIFQTYDELINDLNGKMQSNGYKVVRARSHRSRIGGPDLAGNEVVRVDLVCDRGGRPYECHATKHRTSTKKTGCQWKAKAVFRKMVGGWVLTIICDQHNHEAGTPDPPTPSEKGDDVQDADGEVEEQDQGPQPDAATAGAMAYAGVSKEVLRLTGDTFHQFKQEYRKQTKADRLANLSHMQLRIAAIYAVENEDMQRQQRLEAQERRHKQIEENRRLAPQTKKRPRDSVANGAAVATASSSSSSPAVTASAQQATQVSAPQQHIQPIHQNLQSQSQHSQSSQRTLQPALTSQHQTQPPHQRQHQHQHQQHTSVSHNPQQHQMLQHQAQNAIPMLQHQSFHVPHMQNTPMPAFGHYHVTAQQQQPQPQQTNDSEQVLHPAKRIRTHRPTNSSKS